MYDYLKKNFYCLTEKKTPQLGSGRVFLSTSFLKQKVLHKNIIRQQIFLFFVRKNIRIGSGSLKVVFK